MIRVFAPALAGLIWCALIIFFLSLSSRRSAGGDKGGAHHQVNRVTSLGGVFYIGPRNSFAIRKSPLARDLVERDRTT